MCVTDKQGSVLYFNYSDELDDKKKKKNTTEQS